ncbi:MAG: hypothetical protein PVF58_11345 [Candidatus Methanofastidiosia archaeon]
MTDTKTLFGSSTSWVTYSGTFDEYTGDTSFVIDLTGHTVAGNCFRHAKTERANR